MLDEKEFLSPYGIRSLSRYHAEHPYVFHVGGQEYRRRLPAGRIRHRHVRRQLELARADLDARQRADHPGAAPVLRLLRQRVHRRVSDRLRPADEPLSGRRGDLAPAGQHLPAGRPRPAARERRRRRSSRKIRTGATTSSSTSTSTATTAPASAPATRPAGPASSPAPCTCLRPPPPSRVLELGTSAGALEVEPVPSGPAGSAGENRKALTWPGRRTRRISSTRASV